MTPEVEGALAKLAELREAMVVIKLRSPLYAEGAEPSAADACSLILDAIDWHLGHLAMFLQGGGQ